MNLTTPTTMGELRRLIAEADDLAGTHVLWIDTGGEVHLSADAGNCDDGAVRLRFAPFQAGTGMVGPIAAHDDRLIGKMYFSILHHWLHAGDAPPGPLDAELDDFEREGGWNVSGKTGAHVMNMAPRHGVLGARCH